LEDETATTSSSSPFSLPKKSTSETETNPFGYVIGATNILFKQRLAGELDAYINESDIEIMENSLSSTSTSSTDDKTSKKDSNLNDLSLKKQLQLTTADIRFIDYIIKNVQNSRRNNENDRDNKTPGGINKKSVGGAPTLLSVKRTSSALFNEPPIQLSNESTIAPEWEGSDDWIRLNFKWYLYSLLSSIVKDEICTDITKELDTLFDITTANTTSSSSSAHSLNNNQLDSDNSSSSDHKNVQNNLLLTVIDKKTASDLDTTSVVSSSPSSLSNSSNNSSTSSNINLTQYTMYRDDYNGSFVAALRSTDWFNQWSTKSRSKLEKNLFKIDSSSDSLNTPIIPSTVPATATAATISDSARIQKLMLNWQQLEKIRLAHPFNGQMNVGDLKLRFNYLIATTDSGKKINKALIEGGKIVNSTGKAVGEALSQAKSTFTSFLTNWSLSPSQITSSSPTQELTTKSPPNSKNIIPFNLNSRDNTPNKTK
jgi:hypothetical protein